MRSVTHGFTAALGGVVLLCGCPPQQVASGPEAVFGSVDTAVPLPFESFPFPIDLALTTDGVRVKLPDLGEERAATDVPMNTLMERALAERRGFSGTAAVMFTFGQPLDPTTVAGSSG